MSTNYDLTTVGSYFVELTPIVPGNSLSNARQYNIYAGGAAANVVFALARLGVQVHFISAVGDDDFAAFLLHELSTFGVETSGVRRATEQLTPVSFCAVDLQGGKHFRFYRIPGYSSPMETLTLTDFQPVTSSRLFDISEGSIREPALRALVFQAAQQARAQQIPILYAMNLRKSAWNLPDEAIRDIEWQAITLADIVVLNSEEVSFLTQCPYRDGLPMLHTRGPRVLVMTQGGDGDMLVSVRGAIAAIPPYQVPVIYDVGAGDTFHAGLLAAILHAPTIPLDDLAVWTNAVRFAGATAAIRVSTSGDPRDLPTRDQVEQWMLQH